MVSTENRLIIFFAGKGGGTIYNQPKQIINKTFFLKELLERSNPDGGIEGQALVSYCKSAKIAASFWTPLTGGRRNPPKIGCPRWRSWSWTVLWRPTRPSRINTQKRCPFLYRRLECKSRKSSATWSNRQVQPWSTEWSRAKANRVLPTERTGHSKHPLPTT